MLSCSRPGLTEQPGEQRYKHHADKSDTAAGHELLDSLTFCTWIVVSVAFEQVDAAPDTQSGSKGDNEGLKNFDCTVEKCHKYFLPSANGCPATVSAGGAPFKIFMIF